MTTATVTREPGPNSKALKRYYCDDYQMNSAYDNTDMLREVHALFTHWVQKGFLPKDFGVALEHTGTIAFLSHAMARHPRFEGEAVPPLAETPLAAPLDRVTHGSPLRFYDETGSIGSAVDTRILDRGVAPLFLRWVMDDWHARDFIQALKDAADTIGYDYHLRCTLGGLGGGRTGDEFLARPYAR